MERLEVNPHYKDWLAQQGLSRAEDFLRLAGVIWCGHPDRNVAHITLAEGDIRLSAFLKKEHRVPWKDRLHNALAGFGLVSKSLREARFLRDAARAGVGCPEVIAAGEYQNRAFLLVREVENALDLRGFLSPLSRYSGRGVGGEGQNTLTPGPSPGVPGEGRKSRSQFARKLGEALAAVHKRGLVHRDLFSKHVLIQKTPRDPQFTFLDWQRSRKQRRITWSQCVRELASLDATLADELCSTRERLTCLKSYLRCLNSKHRLSHAARAVRRLSQRLLRKRYVREMRQALLPPGEQNLVWLDGEAVCVTKDFLALATAWAPEGHADDPPALGLRTVRQLQTVVHVQCRQIVHLGAAPRVEAVLVRRQESRFWSWLWRSLRRRAFTSKELSMAATLFRLQRFGVPAPQLLAVGQEFPAPWRVRSFLLLKHSSLRPLSEWRAANDDEQLERTLLAQSAVLLQRIHEAGYVLSKGHDPLDIFAVSQDGSEHAVVLRDPAALRRSK